MKSKKLIDLLRKNQILTHGEFKLRSGLKSSYYCDIKQALGNPVILEMIVKTLAELVPPEATCIAGSGYGGIPLASLVAYRKKLPLVLVRDKVKGYGTKKTVEGYVPTRNDCVCIIDDVFTTGSSIRETKANLSQTKCTFVKPLVVLNRSKTNQVISILRDADLQD
ncbi:MAG: Orotate phosphoribosyltransferase [Parcubacteria group bacterium]|nr:Orotate phosphoribosyltransferase [Parcubacteria group bacterium]